MTRIYFITYVLLNLMFALIDKKLIIIIFYTRIASCCRESCSQGKMDCIIGASRVKLTEAQKGKPSGATLEKGGTGGV